MTLRRVAVAIVLALVAAFVFLWRLDADVTPSAAPPVAVAAVERDSHAAPSTIDVAPAANRDAQETSHRVLKFADGTTLDLDRADASAPRTPLRGTITLVDDDGANREAPDGVFVFHQQEGEATMRDRVAVHAGAFTTNALKGGTLTFESATLDGISADVDVPASGLPIPKNRVLALTARVQPRITLRVRDLETGADLKDVRVYRMAAERESATEYPEVPRSAKGFCAIGDSPLRLSRDNELTSGEVVRLDVGAVGYAWTRVHLDALHARERSVFLARGGTLEMRLKGHKPPSDTHVLLSHAGLAAPVFADAPAPEPGVTLALDGLPIGRWRVALQKDDVGIGPRTLAVADGIEIRAGTIAHVTLESPELPVDEVADGDRRVPLSGILTFAESLPPEWFMLRFTRSERFSFTQFTLANDAMTPIAGNANAVTWATDSAKPGVWDVTLLTGDEEFRWSLNVGRDGRADVDLTLPPPAKLTIHLIDADSGQAFVEAVALHIASSASANEVAREVLGSATFELRAGATTLRSDRGDVTLLDILGVVPSGESERDIRVRHACGILVAVHDDAASIPPCDWRGVRVEAVTGNGTPTEGTGDERMAHRVLVSAPGLYRVTLPAINGYAVAAPREVVVLPGGTAEATFQVEPVK